MGRSHAPRRAPGPATTAGDPADHDGHLRGPRLQHASLAKIADLVPYLGVPVCGLSNIMKLTANDPEGFQPSAAFVAQQAACLVGRAMIARSTGHAIGPMRHVEYDARFSSWYDMTALCRSPVGVRLPVRNVT